MDSRTIEALCDEDLVASRQRHMARLEALYAGEGLEQPFFLNGYSAGFQIRQTPDGPEVLSHPLTGNIRGDCPNPYQEPEAWVDFALEDLARHTWGLQDEAVFRPLCVEFGPYGVHFVDKILGADVYSDDFGEWHTHLLDADPGGLQPPNLALDPTWTLARRIAEAFVATGALVPFFGMPTIASPLNIAVNLYGEKILMAFYTDPDAARRDLALILDGQRELHRWYRAHVPADQLQPVIAAWRCQPPGFGQLCGCSTHLVSAQTYADFVAPLDAALLGVYPRGGMIHLCGSHTHLIPIFRAMKLLRAVQLNDTAAEDLEAYLQGLRPDQVLYVNPCPGMPVEEVLRLSHGRRVVIVSDPPA